MKPLYKTTVRWISLFLLTATAAIGQSSIPDVQWSKTTSRYAVGNNRIEIPTDGTIYGGGYKFSLTGDTLQFLNAPNYPPGITADGGTLGFFYSLTYLPPLDSRRFYVIWGIQKKDAAGNMAFRQVWYESYGPGGPMAPSFQSISRILGTPDNGYIILNYDGSLTKYSPTGEQQWNKQIAHTSASGNAQTIQAQTIINTPDGGLLLTGYLPGIVDDPLNQSNPSTGWVAKLDGQGNIQWEKLLESLSPLNQNRIRSTYTITDACLAADGNGYALVGAGYAFSSLVQAPAHAILLELDSNGKLKRGTPYSNVEPTSAYVALYTGSNGKKYYILGNTSTANPDNDYQLLKISTEPVVSDNDPALLGIVAQRTFRLSDVFPNRLTDLAIAGDGSIVFSGVTGLIKLKPEATNPLMVLAPTYNCQTGAITFNTSGGNGSPITYSAPGITRSSASSNTGIVEQELRNDPKPIPITAYQNGNSATYYFDLKAACATPMPLPPVLVKPIPDQFLTVGQPISGSGFPIGLYFADPSPYIPGYYPTWSFSIQGLPPGLYVFAKDEPGSPNPIRVIFGTPTIPGVYPITVRVATSAFPDKPIIATFTITVSDGTNPGTPLALLPPTYDCQTGAITFNTSGGDGSPITYSAPGITRSSATSNTGIIEQELRNDPKPIPIQATQNGQTVTYVFDFKAYCANPPQPPTTALTLLAPTYDCSTGAFRFNTSGGDGSLIEYMAAGITGWTTNPNQFVDKESRTANDVQPFVLMARQSGVTVSYSWNLKATCGRARLAATEYSGNLTLTPLGNPVQNQLRVLITGAEGQSMQLWLTTLQGRMLEVRQITQTQSENIQQFELDKADSGILLLRASTPMQTQSVKIIKQ